MNNEEFYRKMFPPPDKHDRGCDWHLDQYWWECTCGLISVKELVEEENRRRVRGLR